MGGVADALAASAGVRARAGAWVRKWRYRHAGQREGNLTLAGCSVSIARACVLLEGEGPALALALPLTRRPAAVGAAPVLTARALRSFRRAQECLRAASAPASAGAADDDPRPLLWPLRLRQLGDRAGWEVVFQVRGTNTHALTSRATPRRPGGDCLAALRPRQKQLATLRE